jgi:hypothetical protein
VGYSGFLARFVCLRSKKDMMTFALAVGCSVDLDCDSLREIFDVDERGRKGGEARDRIWTSSHSNSSSKSFGWTDFASAFRTFQFLFYHGWIML